MAVEMRAEASQSRRPVGSLLRLAAEDWTRSHAAIAAGLALAVALTWLLAHGRYRLPIILVVVVWYLFGDLRKVFISSLLLIGMSPIVLLSSAIGWRLDEYLLPVLLARWIMWVSRHPRERHPFRLGTPVAVYLLALWISAASNASAGLAASPHADALHYLFTLMKPLQWVAWFFIAQQLLHEQRVQRWAAGAVAVTLLTVCLIGVAQYLDIFGMRDVVRGIYPIVRQHGAIVPAYMLGEHRATSTFGQPNWFASFIAAGVPLIFVLGALLQPAMRLGLALLAVPAVFLALCYSGSRGGMFAATLGLLVFGALRFRRERSAAGFAVVAALIVTAISLAPYFAAPQQREYGMMAKRYPTSPGFIENILADPRLPAWRYFSGVFFRHPFFGDGAAEIVDNQYLFILVRYGLVGFIAFLVLLSQLLRTGWLAWRRHHGGAGEGIAAAVLAAIVAVLANGVSDAPLQTHRTMELFWLLAAFAVVLASRQAESRGSSETPSTAREMSRSSAPQRQRGGVCYSTEPDRLTERPRARPGGNTADG